MPRTLLLADGSVTIQRVVELTFAHEDVRVVTASDGRRAIQLLESEQPDVVMVDVDLPEVDGYAIASHMRRVPRLKTVPVLLLAGAFEPVDQQKAREVGSDGVIVKPFEPQVVVTRVRELIDRKDRMDAPPPKKPEPVTAAPAESAGVRPAPSQVPDPAAPARPTPAFPRPAPVDPVLEPVAAAPEPLELPTGPIWDPRGSVAQGPPPPAVPPLSVPSVIPQPAPVPPAAAVPAPVPPVPSAPAARVTLANAFTALLAAEQAMPAPVPAPQSMLSEASIEDAVRRVLVRMTDDLVRRIVVDTAERLIREEIERIKANPD